MKIHNFPYRSPLIRSRINQKRKKLGEIFKSQCFRSLDNHQENIFFTHLAPNRIPFMGGSQGYRGRLSDGASPGKYRAISVIFTTKPKIVFVCVFLPIRFFFKKKARKKEANFEIPRYPQMCECRRPAVRYWLRECTTATHHVVVVYGARFPSITAPKDWSDTLL